MLHTILVISLILKDTALTESRVHILSYTPIRVEEVKNILNIEAKLKSIHRLASLDLEVML